MYTKNISILFPKSHFSEVQLQRLEGLGKVSFIESKSLKCPKDTQILVSDGDISKSKLIEFLDSLPEVKYLVLSSSDSSFVDFDYCRQREIIVSSVPFFDADSKAEHIIALLLSSIRRIIANDRLTYKRKYVSELGHNFKGSTLGIVGINPLSERVVELAKCLGATVNIWTEGNIPVRIEGTRRQSLVDTLLVDSDIVSIHLTDSETNKKFFNKERISRLKDDAIVVNLAGRALVDETQMSKALSEGKVSQYIFESDGMGNTPLKNNDNALMFKPFSTNTVETLEKNIEAMVTNIEGVVRGIPFSRMEM